MSGYYAPGTDEQDPKKVIMSLQQAHENAANNADDIATNAANIATNTTNIATNTAAISTLQAPLYGLANTGGALGVSLSKIAASLGADVALNNTANYFDGPSVAQGTTGTWFVSGSVTVSDTASAEKFWAKLWDGTTVISSGSAHVEAAGHYAVISLSGFIAAPAGNLRISVRDPGTTTGQIIFNQSGNSRDSTITAIRIA